MPNLQHKRIVKIDEVKLLPSKRVNISYFISEIVMSESDDEREILNETQSKVHEVTTSYSLLNHSTQKITQAAFSIIKSKEKITEDSLLHTQVTNTIYSALKPHLDTYRQKLLFRGAIIAISIIGIVLSIYQVPRYQERLAWEAVTDSLSAVVYLGKYPNGAHIHEAKYILEKQEWVRVNNSESLLSFRKFLGQFPQSDFFEKASKTLQDLEATKVSLRKIKDKPLKGTITIENEKKFVMLIFSKLKFESNSNWTLDGNFLLDGGRTHYPFYAKADTQKNTITFFDPVKKTPLVPFKKGNMYSLHDKVVFESRQISTYWKFKE